MKGEVEMPPKSERSAYWDNIKGFLILLVVFAHILFQLQNIFPAVNATVDYIYMFHMPAFVFVSGFFGKSPNSRSFPSIIKLIFLYFVFNSIIGFIYGFTSLLQPVYSYWYLIALIVWRLTAHHIAKFKEINLILFITAVFIGFYPTVDNTFAAARIIGFYPYYMAGYKLTDEKNSALISKKYIKRASVGIPILICAGLLAFGAYSYFGYADVDFQMAGYSRSADSFGRIALYIIAFLAIYGIRCLAPKRTIPFLTSFGRNSLWIFVLHRPITLLLSDLIIDLPLVCIILISLLSAFVMCIILGNDIAARYLNRFLQDGADIFISENKKFNLSKLTALCVALWFVISVVLSAYKDFSFSDPVQPASPAYNDEVTENTQQDIIYPAMTQEQKNAFDNALRITFAGDLILLEDQVKRAYDGSKYDFSDVFEYAEPYISSADLAVGVFEGPMAGAEAGYTSSNFDDGKELYLNFPDEFAAAVKNAGFDLVTTANNHLMDKGEKGALRTIDILDKIGLDHTGSYKTPDDKKNNHVKLIECQNIKIAVLSYTYGCNYTDISQLTENGKYAYLTSVISGTDGELFEKLKLSVEEDFRQAKALSPDLIMVLPHIGTQFSNEPDEEQTAWFEIFKQNGADIILGDHPHVVEPALIEDYNGKKIFTAYCPGNFANIYREDQGDTSMLIDVYIDRTSKKITGGSIVPLYTHARADGNYRAVPVYSIMTDTELRKQLTTDDITLAANSNDIITEVVFGSKMDISSVTERYYFNENGFIRSKASGLAVTDDMKNGTLYKALSKADTVCFIGDSVTEGTKNGGCSWYEPIESHFPDKAFLNYSKGGCTVSYMTDHASEIPYADLYVIALGTNDVRYRDESMCAMTAQSYIESLDELKQMLSAISPDSEFVFIAPWYSTDGDPFCSLSFADKTALNNEYSSALKRYCSDNSQAFIDPNPYIRKRLSVFPDRTYLLDHIHPNISKGVVMYSEAVLSYPDNH